MVKYVILAHHRVFDDSRKNSLAVSPKAIERQLDFFIKRGYKNVTLAELTDILLTKPHKNEKYFVITFDDGYKDNYTYALPLLKRKGLVATLFITVGYIGNNQPFHFDKKRFETFLPEDMPLIWEEVKILAENGWEIGSHTLTHSILTSLSEEEAKREIESSKQIIETKLGRDVTSFCYPAGRYNLSIAEMVKEAGYKSAVVSFQSQPLLDGVLRPDVGIFSLSRVALHQGDNLFSEFLKLRGLWETQWVRAAFRGYVSLKKVIQ